MSHWPHANALRYDHPLAQFVLPVLTVLVAASAVEAQSPSTIRLRGTLRDFESSHPDFDVVPGTGLGHYAGNVGMSLPATGRPAHDANGYKVDDEWMDGTFRPIAPHLFVEPGTFSAASATILVDGPIYVRQSEIDSFDPGFGPFGGANIGEEAVIVTNSTAAGSVQILNNAAIRGHLFVGAGADPDDVIAMDHNCTITGETGTLSEPFTIPAVEMPEGMGPSSGDTTLNGGTLSGNLHADDLSIRHNKTVDIDGNVTIMCDDDFKMENHSTLKLLPGATLKLYVKDDFIMENNTSFNVNTNDPSRVQIFVIGSGTILMENSSEVYADIAAPDGELEVGNSGAIGGTVAVKRLTLNNGAARIHAASGAGGNGGTSSCGVPMDDEAGRSGLMGSAGISSAETFDHWFRDILGVNLSTGHSITLLDNGSGVYEYLNDSFYPVDGKLFGNQGDDHNEHFTYAVTARFTYAQCDGQFVEFEGGDGVWIYVDDQLAIDIGGVDATMIQHLDVDRLGLVDGEEYTFKLFYAERLEGASNFRLRTNLQLRQSTTIGGFTAAFD